MQTVPTSVLICVDYLQTHLYKVVLEQTVKHYLDNIALQEEIAY